MESTAINTRADLDLLAGTPAHAAFMAMLAGTLWRIELDAGTQAWAAVADDTIVARYGLTRADFPDATPPELPEVVAQAVAVPAVTPRQARLALLAAGKLAAVEAALAAMPGVTGEAARIDWEFALEIRRDDPLITAVGHVLGLSDEDIDTLFIQASTL